MEKHVPTGPPGEDVLHCPQCGVEYVRGSTECADCRVPLRPGPAPERRLEAEDFVELLRSSNFGDLAMVKSILDQGEVNYFVQGERVNLFPTVLMVDKKDEACARELLKDLQVRFLGSTEP
jgi:hypothetical protein